MNYSRESSAIAYLTSKESEIVPTPFEKLAAQVKQDIQKGRVWGIEPPTEEDAEQKPNRKFTTKEKRDLVNAVNKLRVGGMKYKSALLEVGIFIPSYRKWAKQLDIPIKDLRPMVNHDDAINALMRDGHSMTSACGVFGACRTSFSIRMKKLREKANANGSTIQINQ